MTTHPDTPAATFEFPASFAQQRLWFLEQLEDPGAAYTIRLPVRLRGPLDVARLQAALDQLVARHEALRTTLVARDGEPVQQVAASARVAIERHDATDAAPAAQRRRIGDLSRHVFDLARGPLLRVVLLRLAADDHVLLVLLHHAIADAWSSGILFRDLAEYYTALAEGRTPHLPELAVQYADFASWQRELLVGASCARQLDFWREALAGAPPLLELPTDFPRPALQGFRGSRWTRILPRGLTAALRALGHGEQATLFMVLHAVFCLLLQRHVGSDDIVVGTPVAGRTRTELEPVIGLFASTLALRTGLAGDPPFRELLARVRRIALAAFAHQDLPFEKLVEALAPPRSLSHSPVFQVMFILQNSPWEAATIPGLVVEPAEIDAPEAAKFDLTLSATEFRGELWLAFEYNTDLFAAATIERLAAQFEALARAAVADPDAPIGALPLGEPAAAVAGPPALAPAASVHAMVAAAARARPGAIALECGTVRWTYAMLQDWAEQLADRLRALGAGRGAVVAVALPRGPELPGTLLAVLGSGAAWLSLDPEYPPARLAFMLADSGARLVVTSRALATRFAGAELPLLCIEDLAPAACAATGPAPVPVTPDDLASLIYPSGSTGTPKGVRVTHGSVVNFLASMGREPGLGAGERLLAVTTPGFDIAVLELLGPLVAGGTVVIATVGEARDGAALARLLDAARIDVMQATPATWRLLLAAGWAGRPALRVFCGGEALDPALAAALLARCGELWNLYGPTETTIWSACARITAAHEVSIGGPIAGTTFGILDARDRAVPPGVPGELVIGGVGVSPGYHARPELTAARFREASPGGARRYYTGDRARWLADGRVQLLGRLDAQVKLRGFRIEPGEVEAVLAALPGVAACAVAVREAAPGDPRLVAWVVGAPGASLRGTALRERLRAQLPEYLVPAIVVPLAALPLTPRGTLDRRALPAPDWGVARTGVDGPSVATGVAPAGAAGAGQAPARDGVEAVLCELWAEMLGRTAPVGRDADFFALGGHSLLATRLLARVRDVFGAELALRTLFEGPTPAALAQALPATRTALPAIPRRPAGADAPLTDGQRRLWFLEQLAPGTAAYHLHLAFALQGPLDATALARALQELVARHESLRTTFVAGDGEPRQVIAPRSDVTLAVLDRAGVDDAPLRTELTALVEQPFDLERGPLLRATLLRRAPDRHVLLLVVHHLVVDGWSLAVLLGELAAAYDACRQGGPPALPALTLQYADHAAWQQRPAGREAIARQLAWWQAQLGDAPRRMRLPHDRPRAPVQRHRGARLACAVPADVAAGLHRLARECDATLYMVLLAGFVALLARYGGDEDLVIGTPVAGRGRTELEGLVGFFVNTLALRVEAGGDPPFRELVARVRRAALDAFAHAEVPFEKLVEVLAPPRDPGSTPLFQVMFNLHNEPSQAFALAGLEVERLALVRHVAKFDLTVAVVEHSGGLAVSFEYDTDLFDEPTVLAMSSSYVQLLAEVARDGGVRLGEVQLLDAR
ncbi:MAG: amino acid adenylation domain-containing protein, partial [Gammaproteobacteria bacterium]|nr:amino acid adenylation domain-containing protein [Gammaproteobacteria bacterium]